MVLGPVAAERGVESIGERLEPLDDRRRGRGRGGLRRQRHGGKQQEWNQDLAHRLPPISSRLRQPPDRLPEARLEQHQPGDPKRARRFARRSRRCVAPPKTSFTRQHDDPELDQRDGRQPGVARPGRARPARSGLRRGRAARRCRYRTAPARRSGSGAACAASAAAVAKHVEDGHEQAQIEEDDELGEARPAANRWCGRRRARWRAAAPAAAGTSCAAAQVLILAMSVIAILRLPM